MWSESEPWTPHTYAFPVDESPRAQSQCCGELNSLSEIRICDLQPPRDTGHSYPSVSLRNVVSYDLC